MIIKLPAETRTLLEHITWQTFKTMLAEMGSSRNTRLAYTNGALEIMTPFMLHENSNRLIEAFIGVLCEELELEIKHTGSLTLTRDDLGRGCEPDSSYYIKNESIVRGKEQIDLAIDPPPDLVLEVEYSKPKVNKFEIYATIGVPEFWRFNGAVLQVYVLRNGQYSEVEVSSIFVSTPIKEIPNFIKQTKTDGELKTIRDFRKMVQNLV